MFSIGTILDDLQEQYGVDTTVDFRIYLIAGQVYAPVVFPDVANFSFQSGSKSSNTAAVSTCTITIDDTDGRIKTLIDSTPIEHAQAALYLTTTSGSFALIVGLIADHVWREGTRLYDIILETPIHSEELGYSPTVDDYAPLDTNAENHPWPIVFGKPALSPAHKVVRRRSARLAKGIRLQIDKSNLITGYTLSPGGVYFTKTDNTKIQINPKTQVVSADGALQTIYLTDADEIPKTGTIQLNINNVLFTGTWNGTKFTVTSVNDAMYTNKTYADNFSAVGNFINYTISTVMFENVILRKFDNNGTPNYLPKLPVATGFNSSTQFNVRAISINGIMNFPDFVYTIGKLTADKYLNNSTDTKTIDDIKNVCIGVEKEAIFWAAVDGTEVHINEEEKYIISLGSNVTLGKVYGKTKDELGRPVLRQIPTWYYNPILQHITITPLGQTFKDAYLLRFSKPLIEYEGIQWDEETIYHVSQSSVGPNPMNIIGWIITNFTNLVVDPYTSSIVLGQVANFPMHFTWTKLENALKVCEDIAYQARVAIIITNGVMYFKYLAQLPSPVMVFTEDEILFKSVDLGFVPFTQLTTRSIGEYRTDYRPHDVVRNKKDNPVKKVKFESTNITALGVIEDDKEFFCYNNDFPVRTVMNFWGVRNSSSWRLIEFEAPLYACVLQPFDCIEIDLDITKDVLAIVQSIEIAYALRRVKISAWMPIYGGSDYVVIAAFT